MAVVAVPGGNLVTPPELARDAPGADVLHPVEVHLRVAVGLEPHTAVSHDVEGRCSQVLHVAPPLQGDQRLDPVAGAVAEADRMPERLAGLEAAPPPQGRAG